MLSTTGCCKESYHLGTKVKGKLHMKLAFYVMLAILRTSSICDCAAFTLH